VVLAASWKRSGSRYRERLETLHDGEALGSIVMLQPGSGQRRGTIVWMAARLPSEVDAGPPKQTSDVEGWCDASAIGYR
jgi:hypothetical protein